MYILQNHIDYVEVHILQNHIDCLYSSVRTVHIFIIILAEEYWTNVQVQNYMDRTLQEEPDFRLQISE
jgi:hypothetical protein